MPPMIRLTLASLQEGRSVVPGSNPEGFSPVLIKPESGMQLLTDRHAQHSSQHPIVKYVRDDDFAHAAEKRVAIDARE